MLLQWRPTPARLRPVLVSTRTGAPTSSPPGARGWALLEQVTPLSSGPDVLERIAGALLRWDLHREAGMVLAVSDARVRPGATVVDAASFGPVAVLAPCRVLSTVDEPDRRGFTYAALPGHPLAGEESFTVERDGQGVVVLRIRSRSRPLGVAGLVPPLARAGQRLVNRRYAAAARRLAS